MYLIFIVPFLIDIILNYEIYNKQYTTIQFYENPVCIEPVLGDLCASYKNNDDDINGNDNECYQFITEYEAIDQALERKSFKLDIKNENLCNGWDYDFYLNNFDINFECYTMIMYDNNNCTENMNIKYIEIYQGDCIRLNSTEIYNPKSEDSWNKYYPLFIRSYRGCNSWKNEFFKFSKKRMEYDDESSEYYIKTELTPSGYIFVIMLLMFGTSFCLLFVSLCLFLIQYYILDKREKAKNTINGSHDEKKKEQGVLPIVKKNQGVLHWISQLVKTFLLICTFEVRNVFALWFSAICLLELPTQESNSSYLEYDTINIVIKLWLVGTIVIYITIDIFMMLIWFGKNIYSPFQVGLIYTTYKEWILYRWFSVTVFFIYFSLSTFVQVIMPGFVIQELKQISLTEKNFSKVFSIFYALIKFLIPETFLVLEMIKYLKYDQIGSIRLVDKLKRIEGKEILKFPEIDLSFFNVILTNVEDFLSEVCYTLNLVNCKKDVSVKCNSLMFRHLNWKYIMNLEDDEIKYLKCFFLNDEDCETDKSSNEKKKLYNSFMFDPPMSIKFLSTFFCKFLRRYKVLPIKKPFIETSSEKVEEFCDD